MKFKMKFIGFTSPLVEVVGTEKQFKDDDYFFVLNKKREDWGRELFGREGRK